MNEFIYIGIEDGDGYGDQWTNYHKIKLNNLDLFLLEHMKQDITILSKEEMEESEQNANEWIPDKLDTLESESITDVIEEAKGLYQKFLENWVSTGQNPEEWGCSIGGGIEVTIEKTDKVKREYPEKKYLDKYVPKNLEYIKDINKRILHLEKLYKLLNHKELL